MSKKVKKMEVPEPEPAEEVHNELYYEQNYGGVTFTNCTFNNCNLMTQSGSPPAPPPPPGGGS
jgi:hypothetical protein